jgi:integrase/recombinase XerD
MKSARSRPNPSPSLSLRRLLRGYLAHLRARACAEGTVRNAALYLGNFLTWLEEQGIRAISAVLRQHMEHYQRHLHAYRKRDGQPLVVMGQHVRLTTIQGLFRWLTRRHYLAANPAADLELPRIGRRLPRAVLTAVEAEAVLAQADSSTTFGLRDRAMMEMLYSTGMRRNELCRLALDDLDMARGTVLIREGKGRKDRVVPLGLRATRLLQRYLEGARAQLQSGPDHRAVFLGRDGQMITSGVLGNLVHAYVGASGISKKGSCHLFRHAMATLMLEGGADIRYIQQMLGHARLTTTEIYTRVNISRLVEVHRHTHPAERLAAGRPHQRCPYCGAGRHFSRLL